MSISPIESLMRYALAHRAHGKEQLTLMTADAPTIDRLQSLLHLYQSGYQSVTVDKTVEKLVEMETARLADEAARLRDKVSAYERRYGMSTEDFYARFRAGELGDSMDFVEWSVFRDMYRNTEKRLQTVGGISMSAI